MLWPSGHCAPAVDECEAWELPLVGGGCLAIGPRACARAWDPDSDEDCEAGELLPCPEGFVLSSDGIACLPRFGEDCGEFEVPALGAKCLAVGVSVDELGLSPPFFDPCPNGSLAMAGGGCVQPGPRACPSLWDPEGDYDCDYGDVLPCPAGWATSEDGLYCQPTYDICAPGERPLLGGGCQPVLDAADQCPAEPYPEIPEGAANVVYVSADSKCVDSCGSAEAPFNNLQAAVDSVPAGGHVLVGAGDYAGAAIGKPVTLAGVCSAKVRIGSPTLVPGGPPGFETAGILVAQTQNVHITGLGIKSPSIGLFVVNVMDSTVASVEIYGAVGTAVAAAGFTMVKFESCWLHDTVPGNSAAGLVGMGVVAGEGANVSLVSSAIDSATGFALFAQDPGTVLSAVDSVFRNTEPHGPFSLGEGGFAMGGGELALDGVVIESSSKLGVEVAEGASALLENSVVRFTSTVESELTSAGLLVHAGGTAEVRSSFFEANGETGLVVGGQQAGLLVEKTVVLGGDPEEPSTFGAGIWVGADGQLTVRGCLVSGGADNGIAASGVGASGVVSGTVATGTVPVDNDVPAATIGVADGGSLEIRLSLVEDNFGDGLSATGSDTTLMVSGVTVRTSWTGNDKAPGVGLNAYLGATVTMDNTVLEENKVGGAISWTPGTTVQMNECVVRDNTAADDGTSLGGLSAFDGGALHFVDGSIDSNASYGLQAFGEGSNLSIESSVVRDTKADLSGGASAGLAALDGGSAQATGCLVDSNAVIGASAVGAQSKLSVQGSVISGTTSGASEPGGRGIEISLGAQGLVKGTLIENNTLAGTVVAGAGSYLDLSESVVRSSALMSGDEMLAGVYVLEGGSVDVSKCLISDNVSAGLLVSDPGSTALVEDSAIIRTVPGSTGGFGRGLNVLWGAHARTERTLLAFNSEAGVRCTNPDTVLEVSGCAVADTQPIVDGTQGRGFNLGDGCQAHISNSLVERNREVGVFVTGVGTECTLTRSVVRDNQPGLTTGGFGMMVTKFSHASIAGSLFRANREGGIVGLWTATTVDMMGSLVLSTLSDSNKYYGNGLIAEKGVEFDLYRVLLSDNDSTAIAAAGQGATIIAKECAVSDTTRGLAELADLGETQMFGDGFYMGHWSYLDAVDCVISGNFRCGIYFFQSSGRLSGNVITGNGAFGLAMEDCDASVDFVELGNHIFGNGLNLPPAQAAEITDNPTGLPPPAIPDSLPR